VPSLSLELVLEQPSARLAKRKAEWAIAFDDKQIDAAPGFTFGAVARASPIREKMNGPSALRAASTNDGARGSRH
jgi:hypothetical protein